MTVALRESNENYNSKQREILPPVVVLEAGYGVGGHNWHSSGHCPPRKTGFSRESS